MKGFQFWGWETLQKAEATFEEKLYKWFEGEALRSLQLKEERIRGLED